MVSSLSTMSKTRKLLFTFLRNAIWRIEHDVPKELSEEEVSRLISVADEQTVSGLAVEAIIQNDIKIPQEWVFEAVGIDTQTKQANKQLNDELKEFVRLSLKDYVVVKGQTIAAIYPNPMARLSGDIDFLVQDYPAAKELLKKEWCIELPSKLFDREFAFEHGGVTYEIHDQLIVFGSRKHQRYWDELLKRPSYYVSIDGVQIPTLAPTVNAIYVFVHLFFHFLREGVSLRQFCDWAMVLHHYRDEIVCKDLMVALDQLELVKAYKALGCILVDDLGLPKEDFPYKLNEEDRKWHNKLLDDIFKGGNFGKLNHQANGTWKYKIETIGVALRNTFKYYRLCPSEVGGMIPRLMKVNLKVLLKR